MRPRASRFGRPSSRWTSPGATGLPASTRSHRRGRAGRSGSSGRKATATPTAISPSSGARQRSATGDIETALALAQKAVDIGTRAADADLQGLRAVEPRLPEDRQRATTAGRIRADGGGVDRGRQRRAVAVHDRSHGLPDDRRLPRPDRLPPGQRMDRGHREVLRSPVARRVPRRVPDPPRRGRRRRRGMGTRGAGAGARDDRARRAINATPPQADGFYAIGDIRRLRGDFEGAEAALREAHAARPHPRSRRWPSSASAEGKVKAAPCRDQRGASPRRPGIAGRAPGCCRPRSRSRSRPATSTGRADGRRRAGRDRRRATRRRRSRPAARSRSAASCSPRATRRAPIRELRAAIKGWREVGAPYEVARARARPVDAPAGRRRRRRRRSRAAAPRSTSSAGSARGSMSRRPSASCGTSRIARSGPVTSRRTFMFTDIVGSTSLAEALGDQRLGAAAALARRHAPATVVAAGEGRSSTRPATGSSPPSSRPATRGRLRHRDPAGAARPPGEAPASPPPVRIGLHTADANRRGDDYSGMGVHVAARVAPSPAVARSSPRRRRSRRPAMSRLGTRGRSTVKGVTEPVDIADIVWAD